MKTACIHLTVFTTLFLTLLAGCGTARALWPPSTLAAIGSSFQNAIRQDGELAGVVLGATDVVPDTTINLRGFYVCAVAIDGKAWADLTPAQQNRVLNKVGLHLKTAVAESAPARGNLVSAVLVNDLKQEFGAISTDGVVLTGRANR